VFSSRSFQVRVNSVQLQHRTLAACTCSRFSVDLAYAYKRKCVGITSRLTDSQSFGAVFDPSTIHQTHFRKLSSVPASQKQVRDAMNDFQDLFVEARLSIEDVQESLDTTYFEEELGVAKDAVRTALEAFDSVAELLKDDVDQLNEFKRANIMKVKQLQEELKMVSEHYLHE